MLTLQQVWWVVWISRLAAPTTGAQVFHFPFTLVLNWARSLEDLPPLVKMSASAAITEYQIRTQKEGLLNYTAVP